MHIFLFLKTFVFFDMMFFFFLNILSPLLDNFAISLMWNDVGVLCNRLINNVIC